MVVGDALRQDASGVVAEARLTPVYTVCDRLLAAIEYLARVPVSFWHVLFFGGIPVYCCPYVNEEAGTQRT